MPDGTHAKKGDIVICSVNGRNFTEPCGLGKVYLVKNVNLPAGHNDGPKGEVFVVPFDRQNLRGRISLAQLKSKFVHFLLVHAMYIFCSSVNHQPSQ